jgi:hypothetical protein
MLQPLNKFQPDREKTARRRARRATAMLHRPAGIRSNEA